MEWRDGKLYINLEDQADLMRGLAARSPDGESAVELRRVARDCSAKAADPARPLPVIRRMRTTTIALEDAFFAAFKPTGF